jgi:probable F420-dependent oxidoreductase
VTLQVGMSVTGVDDIVGMAQRLEELGYDYVGVGEHISFHLPTSSPLIALAAAAAVTTRIKLLSTVVLAPLYPAALLAKMTAALDQVSNGRFNLGVGIGGENPAEFEACGIPVSERGRRCDEVVTILRRLWTEEQVDHDGQWARLRGISIRPRPVQEPHPPIWISGRKDPAVRRAARLGDGWMPYLLTPEMFAASLVTLDEFCQQFERPAADVERAAFVFTSCHEDPKLARQMAVDRLSMQYDQDFSTLVDRYVVYGTPGMCVARFREYIDAGAQKLFLGSACGAADARHNETLLATEVLPRLR